MNPEIYFMGLVALLFVLAIFDLTIGVSNDAVNFLHSAVGSKAANIKVVLIIAAIGVFVGATFSNGMMEIARRGIFQPQEFFFYEIILILVAAMVTDVILLDLFNNLGLPTSTTVSLVFELLGATFAVASIKIIQDPNLSYELLLNTDKALQVILAIFVSVALAFFFGTIVMYLTRVLFTFNYKVNMKFFGAIFGGIAVTSIIYFMLIKGLKDTTFMNGDNKDYIQNHTSEILLVCFGFFTVLMQCLMWLRVNILKIVVLVGTFALAFAFAGNDLVNFIGMPLAGFSAFKEYMAQGGGDIYNTLKMEALNSPAVTEWYFLIIAGAIMVIALVFSKKAKKVINTSIGLSKQGDTDEMFSSSNIARNVVRGTRRMATYIVNVTPNSVSNWLNDRFSREGIKEEDNAAFDLLRASVNLVVASSLIAIGTSFKLPLSTTYVTFMVAMGASLADRAWGRESAVYRVSGVINVVGGWFITAIAAFSITAVIAVGLYFGGKIAVLILILVAAIVLIRSQISFKRKSNKVVASKTVDDLLSSDNPDEALQILRKYSKENAIETLHYVSERYSQVIDAFCNEELKILRNLSGKIDSHKDDVKKIKRLGTLGIRKLSPTDAFERGLYFYQANDFIGELIYSLSKISVACEEHIANNFNPLNEEQKEELQKTKTSIVEFINNCLDILDAGTFEENYNYYANNEEYLEDFHTMKRKQLKRIQLYQQSTKASLVYISIVQETQTIVSYTTNIMKVNRKLLQNS
ncbi:MAG: inorganic phosphate transporter [Bacteroidales bacterium]|jgi:phosphate/sulfate permease|nr:inorganic phosphate transporter [Bacteroidales bacterium]